MATMDLRKAHIDPLLIEDLRQQIYAYLENSNNAASFDLEDVRRRIKPPTCEFKKPSKNEVPDIMLRRLILSLKAGQDLEVAVKLFSEAFQFRAQFSLTKTKLQDVIPLEFYTVSPFICDGIDRKNYQVFIVRVKYYRKLPQFDTLIKNGFIYLLEQFDLKFENGEFNGATVILDLQDFDWWTHYNFDLVRFVFQGFYHYRGLVKTVLIHKFPWALGWMLRLIESWIMAIRGYQRKTIHLVDETNIYDFVDADQLPEFLYGTRPRFVEKPPAEVVPIVEMLKNTQNVKHNLSEKNAEIIIKYVEELLDQVETD